MKKKVFSAALVLLLLALVMGGTLAFFTEDVRTRNVVTTGKVDIELKEFRDLAMTEAYPAEAVPVAPGTKVTKVVVVENTGASDAWVRVKVTPTVELSDGTAGSPACIGLNFDSANWLKDGDYYYYRTPLSNDSAAPALTPPLFDTVTFAGVMDNAYQGSMAFVSVSAEAVQVKNNNPVSQLTTHDDVAQINGWPS